MPDKTNDTVIATVMEQLIAEGPQAMAQVITALMAQEGCFSVCEDLAKQWLCFGDYLTPTEIAAKYAAVTADDIARVAGRLLREPKPTVAAIGPATGLPDAGSWAKALAA